MFVPLNMQLILVYFSDLILLSIYVYWSLGITFACVMIISVRYLQFLLDMTFIYVSNLDM